MILRAYQKEDAAILCTWIRTEDELYKWSADRFNKFPLLAKDIQDSYVPQIRNGRFIPLTATDEDGQMIGHFIIRYPRDDDDSTVRFGFVIVDPAHRGKGCGKEMLRLGIAYVKEHLSAGRIDLRVFANNENARRCYESLGFRAYQTRKCEMPVGVWDCTDMELFCDVPQFAGDASDNGSACSRTNEERRSTMTVRRAANSDIPGILALLVQVDMVHHNGRPDLFKGPATKYNADELKTILADDTTPVFVCVDENKVLGHAFCIYRQLLNDPVLTDIRTLYIDDICVDEKVRGKHVGKRLYEHVLAYAKENGFYNITLNVWSCNPGAIRFYESLGFQPQKIGMEVVL